MSMLNRKTKLLASVLAAYTTLSIVSCFAMPVRAVNEEFDSTEDNMISQNEQYTDCINEAGSDAPYISATAYMLYDVQSGDVLLGNNIDQRLEPASTTKIMTILLALENLNMEDTVTITENMYASIPDDYVKLGITAGEVVYVRDLVHAGLMKSCNDACLALAIHMDGSEAAFCQRMNQRALELGCTNTTFTSAYGFADPNNLTTAHDLALIMQEAATIQDFLDISTSYQYMMTATNYYNDVREILSTNMFICSQEYAYDYYIGGKTGYTETAGYTLVSAAEKNGRRLIGVILGSPGPGLRYSDMISMFEYGYSHYSTIQIDQSEFSSIYENTVAQINASLVNTNLHVSEANMEFSGYLTTTSSRLSGGSSNMIELSGLLIDPNESDQIFKAPLCKCFNDGKIYIVGCMTIRISDKDKVIEITPEKNSIFSTVKVVLIAVISLVCMFLILIFSFSVFRKKHVRRNNRHYRNTNHRL